MNKSATSSSLSSSLPRDQSNTLGGVRRRNDENEVQRNVRQNVGADASTEASGIDRGTFMSKVELDLKNVKVCKSNTPGVVQQRPFNPNSNLISLRDLILNGSKQGRLAGTTR